MRDPRFNKTFLDKSLSILYEPKFAVQQFSNDLPLAPNTIVNEVRPTGEFRPIAEENFEMLKELKDELL